MAPDQLESLLIELQPMSSTSQRLRCLLFDHSLAPPFERAVSLRMRALKAVMDSSVGGALGSGVRYCSEAQMEKARRVPLVLCSGSELLFDLVPQDISHITAIFETLPDSSQAPGHPEENTGR